MIVPTTTTTSRPRIRRRKILYRKASLWCSPELLFFLLLVSIQQRQRQPQRRAFGVSVAVAFSISAIPRTTTTRSIADSTVLHRTKGRAWTCLRHHSSLFGREDEDDTSSAEATTTTTKPSLQRQQPSWRHRIYYRLGGAKFGTRTTTASHSRHALASSEQVQCMALFVVNRLGILWLRKHHPKRIFWFSNEPKKKKNSHASFVLRGGEEEVTTKKSKPSSSINNNNNNNNSSSSKPMRKPKQFEQERDAFLEVETLRHKENDKWIQEPWNEKANESSDTPHHHNNHNHMAYLASPLIQPETLHPVVRPHGTPRLLHFTVFRPPVAKKSPTFSWIPNQDDPVIFVPTNKEQKDFHMSVLQQIKDVAIVELDQQQQQQQQLYDSDDIDDNDNNNNNVPKSKNGSKPKKKKRKKKKRPGPFFVQSEQLVVSLTFRYRRPRHHFQPQSNTTTNSSSSSSGHHHPSRRWLHPHYVHSQVTGSGGGDGDVDNLAKFVLDALKNVVYHDDGQVVALSSTKIWSNDPASVGSTTVVVWALSSSTTTSSSSSSSWTTNSSSSTFFV